MSPRIFSPHLRGAKMNIVLYDVEEEEGKKLFVLI